ncbi:MAG: hypothetical protein AAB851_03055 [Patescibacteria group bacterium]
MNLQAISVCLASRLPAGMALGDDFVFTFENKNKLAVSYFFEKILIMSKLEKIIFWSGLIMIIIDNITWQWRFKLILDPPFGGNIFRWQSISEDIILLAVWFYILVRIYKKANLKEQGKDK